MPQAQQSPFAATEGQNNRTTSRMKTQETGKAYSPVTWTSLKETQNTNVKVVSDSAPVASLHH